MKTREQIEKRIADHGQQIVHLKEMAAIEMGKVSERIAKYSADPEYVAKWIDNWMQHVNYCNEQIVELNKTIHMLEWVIED